MSAPVKPGDVLGGKYEVERILGEGGMGVVVAAQHLQLGQRVAIKFMLPAAFDAEATLRFNREARAASKLRSEHVARVLDTGTFETGAPYIVMEYMEGSDLSDELLRTGPMAPAAAAEYIVQACDAIGEAHSLGIVHRDLKPANLFLTRRVDGSPLVKVLDFGISKATAPGDAGLGLTKTSTVMGSPLYMSPEQMKSAKVVDPRTDVWALGTILYELLAGRPPFLADSLGELMAMVLSEPPPRLDSVRQGLPAPLYAIVDWCLAKDRERRCPNVAEIARALAPFAHTRVQPIVERILHVVGGPTSGPAPAAVSPHAQTAPLTPLIQTANAWSGTLKPSEATTRPPTQGTGLQPIIALCAFLALAAIGGIAFKLSRGPVKSQVASSPTIETTVQPIVSAAPPRSDEVLEAPKPSAMPVEPPAPRPVARPSLRPAVSAPAPTPAPAPSAAPKANIFDTSN